MRSAVVLTLLLLGAAAVVAQGVPTAVCNTDPAKANPNYFLIWAKQNSDGLVFTEPKTVTPNICKDDWKSGTCCDEKKLKDMFEAKAKDHSKSWGKFMGAANSFKGQIKKYQKVAQNKADVTKTLEDSNSKKADKKPPTGLEPAKAAEFLATVSSYEDDLANFKKTNGKSCFRSVHPYRGKIMCAGCSATGYQYFSQGPTFNYLSGSCNQLVEACAPAWAFMAKFEIYNLLFSEIAVSKKGKATSRDPKSVFYGSKLPSEIVTLIEKCPTGKVGDKCTTQDIDNYCQAYLSFAKAEQAADVPEGDGATPQIPEGARVLQGSTIDIGAGTVSATGIDLKTSTSAGLTSSENVDGALGDSSNLLSVSLMLLAAFAAVLN